MAAKTRVLKIQTTVHVALTARQADILALMAETDRRTKVDFVRLLIEDEYERRQKAADEYERRQTNAHRRLKKAGIVEKVKRKI